MEKSKSPGAFSGILAFALLFFMAASHCASANNLTVEKSAEKEDLIVGGSVTISLKVSNPFDKAIKVKIQDKNIIAGNGLIIKCLEREVPAGSATKVEYEPIELYKEGKYELGKATVSYTDPKGDKEATAESNKLTLEVGGSSSNDAVVQGITEIYNCDGISTTSTRMASSGGGSSFSVSIGGSGGAGNIAQASSGSQANVPSDSQENSKSPEEDNLKAIIESDSAYLNEQEKINHEGYILQGRHINATGNNSGSFVYLFRNAGKKAYLKGSVRDGSVESIERVKDNSVNLPLLMLIAAILMIALMIALLGKKESSSGKIRTRTQPKAKIKDDKGMIRKREEESDKKSSEGRSDEKHGPSEDKEVHKKPGEDVQKPDYAAALSKARELLAKKDYEGAIETAYRNSKQRLKEIAGQSLGRGVSDRELLEALKARDNKAYMKAKEINAISSQARFAKDYSKEPAERLIRLFGEIL